VLLYVAGVRVVAFGTSAAWKWPQNDSHRVRDGRDFGTDYRSYKDRVRLKCLRAMGTTFLKAPPKVTGILNFW